MKLSKTVDKIERVAPGMVLVDSTDLVSFFDRQIWSQGKARKRSTCILTCKAIAVGEMVYRPITNAANRGKRMLSTAVDAVADGGRLCGICKTPMDQPDKPATLNCGGDCRRCMADAGDPDCIRYFRNHPEALQEVKHG